MEDKYWDSDELGSLHFSLCEAIRCVTEAGEHTLVDKQDVIEWLLILQSTILAVSLDKLVIIKAPKGEK